MRPELDGLETHDQPAMDVSRSFQACAHMELILMVMQELREAMQELRESRLPVMITGRSTRWR